ncbi:hypothetical protein IHE44_0006941 [Lamprotornis superbus]|uniref:Uncharacterized protein n=1 Tax=Lamprotornis superbus TaxID=245042 RepID=A0A835NW07_9PASS|nr:hypothetical protein IHE44_0006941 [Lamprotornis superbus]
MQRNPVQSQSSQDKSLHIEAVSCLWQVPRKSESQSVSPPKVLPTKIRRFPMNKENNPWHLV